MKYTIISEKTNTGYSAYSPDLPGWMQKVFKDRLVVLFDFFYPKGYFGRYND